MSSRPFHIKAIFAERELSPEATVRCYRIVRTEGARKVTREIEHHNLEAAFSTSFSNPPVPSRHNSTHTPHASATIDAVITVVIHGAIVDDAQMEADAPRATIAVQDGR